MPAFLLTIWLKIDSVFQKFLSWSPFIAGLCIGYFGHPLIELALKALGDLIKLI